MFRRAEEEEAQEKENARRRMNEEIVEYFCKSLRNKIESIERNVFNFRSLISRALFNRNHCITMPGEQCAIKGILDTRSGSCEEIRKNETVFDVARFTFVHFRHRSSAFMETAGLLASGM